jgi:predicted small lipoprotein YifL
MKLRVPRLIAICVALASTAGCGLKGPLYLPEKTGTVVTRPGGADAGAPQAEDPDRKDDKKEDKEGETPK